MKIKIDNYEEKITCQKLGQMIKLAEANGLRLKFRGYIINDSTGTTYPLDMYLREPEETIRVVKTCG